jgi:pSer/pThr/pTyr-binding forkhead associated (FHA) protein
VTDDPNSKKDTSFLDTPRSQPMQDRPPRPDTRILGPDWKVEFAFEDRKMVVNIQNTMLIGRVVDDDDPAMFALELSSFGGYQSGVSRQHAAITWHEGSLYLEDLGSTNGTRINENQLTARRKYRLRDGDVIEFARLKARIRFVPAAEARSQK